MASFEQIVSDHLCKTNSTLEKIKMLLEAKETRDTDIIFILIPENAGRRVFAAGTTKIDFLNGNITNPDGTAERIDVKLAGFGRQWLHSLSIDADQDVVIRIGPFKKRTIYANFSTQIPYLTYNQLEVTCTAATNIQLFACTNPSAIIGQFKVMDVSQTNIVGDQTEAQTWDTVSTLLNNMNRIRNQIISITGEAWGTVSHSIATVWGKFNATTGHKHTGAADDAPKLSVSSVTNAESTANKNAASGYAGLDASSHLTPSQVNFFMSSSDVTASRAYGTVYQNTSGKPMHVVVWSMAIAGWNSDLMAYSDAANPPTTAVSKAYSPASKPALVTFMVMPNHYYKVTEGTNSTLNGWIEAL